MRPLRLNISELPESAGLPSVAGDLNEPFLTALELFQQKGGRA